MTNFSPWPAFSQDEIDAVESVLRSNKVNYWTGEICRSFELEFAAWVGTRYAVSLANGTLALDAALLSLGIASGDEVVVTSRTFIATVSSVINVGATPIFADVDLRSGNVSADTISAVLTSRTKAIICVHLAGWPCDMDPILTLAKEHGIKIVEDCAQAHGARYKGRSVGSIGDVSAWSFCQDKIMSTGGEGGMITTNNEDIWRFVWSLKDHGKNYDSVYRRVHPPGFRWLHDSFGTNWRMMEMQGAIGRIQLTLMKDWSAKRTSNANLIWSTCRQFPALRVPEFGCYSCKGHCREDKSSQVCVHAHYKCYVYVRHENLAEGWSRDRIIEEINNCGAPCYQGSCSEVYLEKAFDNTGFRPIERLPNARELGDTSLMFLVHPTLNRQEIQATCNAIELVMAKASK
jgi:dTDP-4-amino-4,6-dideoxygalactose transaminase